MTCDVLLTSVNDTCDVSLTSVNDTCDVSLTSVNDTCDVSLTSVNDTCDVSLTSSCLSTLATFTVTKETRRGSVDSGTVETAGEMN